MSFRVLTQVLPANLAFKEKMVLIQLAHRADDDGSNAFPCIARMAAESGLGKRSIQRTIRSLRDMRLIEIQHPAGALVNGVTRPSITYRIVTKNLPGPAWLGSKAKTKAKSVSAAVGIEGLGAETEGLAEKAGQINSGPRAAKRARELAPNKEEPRRNSQGCPGDIPVLAARGDSGSSTERQTGDVESVSRSPYSSQDSIHDSSHVDGTRRASIRACNENPHSKPERSSLELPNWMTARADPSVDPAALSLWQNVLAKVINEADPNLARRWLIEIELAKLDEDTATLRVREFQVIHVELHFQELFAKALRRRVRVIRREAAR